MQTDAPADAAPTRSAVHPDRAPTSIAGVPRRSWKGPSGGLLAVLAVAVVAGCGGGPPVRELYLEDMEGAPGVDPEFEYLPEYRIRVGDQMRIEFLSDPEPATSASEVIVRPDGRISLRGVDDVLAAGRTPAELDSVLTVRFAQLLVDPQLSIIVETFSREKIYVLGQVQRPREVAMVGPTSVLQAIASAGGFEVGANRNQVVVVRRLGGGRLGAFVVDTEPIMEAKAGAREVSLYAQDVVIVPKTRIAKVGDFVGQYFENLNPALLSAFWVSRIFTE